MEFIGSFLILIASEAGRRRAAAGGARVCFLLNQLRPTAAAATEST